MSRTLYRSSTNKVIAGVCGGIGEYFDIDPTLLRLIAVVGVFASGGLVFVAYLLGWIIIPQPYPGSATPTETAAPEVTEPHRRRLDNKWRTYLPGLILVGLGAILLAKEYIWWFGWDDLWPILIVVVGLFLILRNGRHPRRESSPTGDQPDEDQSFEGPDGGRTP